MTLDHSVSDRVGAVIDLAAAEYYRNRELSWLEFNRRVLHEALDARTPLLERAKFLSIFSSNLDEFFQVRVAGVREQVAAGVSNQEADATPPDRQLVAIRETVRSMLDQHSRCIVHDLVPELASYGIHLHNDWDALSSRERAHLSAYFLANVYPVLTPLAVDPAHPFPHISNLSLSLAISLLDESGQERFARVKVPRILPRWVPMLAANSFFPLELLIGAHLTALFPGITILGWHLFRITRNSDLSLVVGQGDNDEADDLLELIQEEVRNRRFGEVVRIEVHSSMPESVRELLLDEFNEAHAGEGLPLVADDIFEVGGMLDATALMAMAELDFPELKNQPFHPVVPPRLAASEDLFATIREGDLLLHHPYESFDASIERLIAAAADDPDVLAIKITLYRTGSGIAQLLARAAEQGKQVAVLIELQARFDEENNISWARRFEEIGVHVSYGDAGLKTHAKVLLVVRREGKSIRRYVHIGTGNYNPKTARLYTDLGLLTCDEAIGTDVSALFNVLTGFAVPTDYESLVVAPRWMKGRLLALIEAEMRHAREGRRGRILAKMNSLVDRDVIRALYRASQAGVEIDLIVRGICCLRPGVPGVSDNIRVRSIVGRFLEHSRAMVFGNGAREQVFISSADWMPRNLDRRVEASVPIEDPKLRAEIRSLLELMLHDNRQAWELQADGSYVQLHSADGEEELSIQERLIERPWR